MTVAAWVRPAVVKEVRALLPAWLLCATAMGALIILRAMARDHLVSFALLDVLLLLAPIAWFSPVAIGALSIGQEFSHRTLEGFLSQPARRSQLFLVKLGVLVALLVLWDVALIPVARLHLFSESRDWLWFSGQPFVLPIVYGLCVAPWLSMVSRSALAGTLMTLALPSLLLILGSSAGFILHGPAHDGDDWNVLAPQILWRGTWAIAAVGAALGWRTAMRLETPNGGHEAVSAPAWLIAWKDAAMETSRGAAPTRRQRPLWALVKKELRLQRMPFVVAGLYATATIAWLTGASNPPWLPRDFPPFAYAWLLPILVGSLASAGERQSGTIEWQMLMPLATRAQWAVKIAVAIAVALALAVALPSLLASVVPGFAAAVRPLSIFVLLTAWSLYISSLCSQSFRAFLVSLATMIASWLWLRSTGEFVRWFWTVGRPEFDGLARHLFTPGQAISIQSQLVHSPELVICVMLAPACLLALWFARGNHTSAERGAARIWRQAAWIATCLLLSQFLIFGIGALSSIPA